MSWYVVNVRTRAMVAGAENGCVRFTTARAEALSFESQGRARTWADVNAGPGDPLALSRDPEPFEPGANNRGRPNHYGARRKA